jgi:hypothetical protein
MARSFQKELDQIAEKADTSTPAGLSYVLTGKTKIYMLFDFTTSYYFTFKLLLLPLLVGCCTAAATAQLSTTAVLYYPIPIN